MKSGVGFAARHQGEHHVATAQIATTGLISLNYAHKLSEKVGPDAQLFVTCFGHRVSCILLGWALVVLVFAFQTFSNTAQDHYSPGQQ